jgi:hypothetical protein
MAYHPLLDWRLGLDMVRLALDADAAIDLGFGYWSTLATQTAQPYFEGLNLTHTMFGSLHAGISDTTNSAVILVHPLWDRDERNYIADLAAAVSDARSRGLSIELRSIFHAIRFPYE